MARALKAFIDCNALRKNLKLVRSLAPQAKILAMVKANGYGHGIVHVARILQTADALGVACIEEAVELREAGVANRIVLMEGFFEEQEIPDIIRLNLELVVHHTAHLKALAAFEDPLKIWIKINTGMNRLGFSIPEVVEVYHQLMNNLSLKIEGFLTHFAKADEIDDPLNQQQLEDFFKVISHLPGTKSLANSAAILSNKRAHADWVRPGIMLYGVSPFPNRYGALEGLSTVMALRSALIAVQSLKAGDSIGYGGEFICQKPMKMGIVAVGYGDGYPRLAKTGTPVLVNNQQSQLLGRVSMDMIAVDLSGQPEAKVGDPVELWGPNLPIEWVAEAIGTTAYELMTGLSTRVPLELIDP